MNRIVFFLEDAYMTLYDNIGGNVSCYVQRDDWLDDFFSGQEYKKESTIDYFLPALLEMKTPAKRLANEEKTIEDIANVKILYSSLRGLSPLQATNKYMWACLTHTMYKDYVTHRWMDETLSDERKATRIERVFFFTKRETQSRAIEINAISRLWWYGHVSYDDANPTNPFHLTEILVSNTKFCRDFMLSKCCESRTVAKGVLLAIADFIPMLEKGEGISGYYRNYLKKYLNRYGAVTSLDLLDVEEVHNLSLNYLIGVRKAKGKVEDAIDEDIDIDDLE